MIYGYCLFYDGDIIPYPNIDEREQIQESWRKPAKPCMGRQGVECNLKQDLRSCAGIRYATDWPSVALLGVSKGIQQEAARFLFGKNVWRLSYVEHWEMGEEKDFWFSYARHFRHISSHMTLNDAGNMLYFIKEARAAGNSGQWSHTRMKEAVHEASLFCLGNSFEWKHELLDQMNLKSLVFNIENLLCPHGCCRKKALHIFCEEMSRGGPGYRLGVDENVGRSWEATTESVLDVETKRKVDVKVVGLEDDSEKEIFMEHWGLEVD